MRDAYRLRSGILLSGILAIVVLLICARPSTSEPVPDASVARELVIQADSGMFRVGEELIYNVSYAFINVGQIRIKVLDRVASGSAAYYRAIAHMDSYDGVPFVDLHAIFESNILDGTHSIWFRSREKKEARHWYTTYDFQYEKRRIDIQKGWWGARKVEMRETLPADSLLQDGLSLFFYARNNVKSARSVEVPLVVKEERVSALLNFYDKPIKVEVDAIKYPVDVIELDGTAKFVGIFGMTGDFQGWFSNDEACIPILAKMKVIIGSIRIELMQWNREGWTPPRYIESAGK